MILLTYSTKVISRNLLILPKKMNTVERVVNWIGFAVKLQLTEFTIVKCFLPNLIRTWTNLRNQWPVL
jgi:hypothetical protein